MGAGIIDSTGILELVGFLEKHYGIAVTAEEIVPEHFESVHSISRLVKSKSPPA